MAKLEYDKASELISQIKDKYPQGEKRRFMLMQILKSLFNSFPSKKIATQRVNGMILTHDLDMTDKIKLFRI